MTSRLFRSSTLALTAVATAAFGGVAPASLSAQASPAASAPLVASLGQDPLPALDFSKFVTDSKADDASSAAESSSQPTVADERMTLAADPTGTGAMQPPPRRYGRPRYNDGGHNADGSSKYTFEAAAGLTLPLGDTYKYFNTGYAFSVGGGRNFNKHLGVLIQFDYDHFGINKATLDSQAGLYNNGSPSSPISGCGPGQGESGCALPVDGNNHVWSFTVDPTYTFYQGDKYGAYAVVGAGFYHKVTNFTTPETGEYYDPYYGPIAVTENTVFDHYTSNAFGGNAGLGLTYKFSRFANERFFVEARYVIVDNPQRQGYTYSSTTALSGSSANDYFPANSNKTTYVPIKVGVRF